MASSQKKRQKRKRPDPSQNGRVSEDQLNGRVLYDVSGVRRLKESDPRREQIDERNEPTWVEVGSLDHRLLTKHVPLGQRMAAGVPPREYHTGSHGILVRGKRHQCAAAAKVGKSIGWQSHLTRMCLDGETVLYIDRENGADEFVRRLACFAKAWDLSAKDLNLIDQRFLYFEYPRLEITDLEGLNRVIAAEGADLIVFDSQRMVLSDMGLAEDSSDEYGRFMNRLVMGLNCTVLILDNTGHTDKDRGRGTSSKIDMNEVLLTMNDIKAFDVNAEGELELRIEQTRFDREGPWKMVIGGGTYGRWELSGPPPPPEDVVLSTLPSDGSVVTGNEMARAWQGRSYGDHTMRSVREKLIAEGRIGTSGGGGRGKTGHYWRVR